MSEIKEPRVKSETRFELRTLGYTDEEIDKIIIMLDDVISDESSNVIPRAFHKGEWCNKINRTCSEGYCDQCEPVVNKENYKRE